MDETKTIVLDDIFAGHVHLREGPLLDVTIPLNYPYSCVVHIPNTKDPVDSGERLEEHQKEVLARFPDFQIIWGIMLTKRTTKEGMRQAYDLGAKFIKYIPADTSTNSGSGIGIGLDELPNFYYLIDYALSLGMAFLMHAERIRTKRGEEIPFVHREEEAIPDVYKLHEAFRSKKIRIEHVSTGIMLNFLRGIFHAALAPQHARKTFSQVFDAFGQIIQENFCMPILKPYDDMMAIRKEMVFGNYDECRYGPDDAIHDWMKKLRGIPGVFVPPFTALPILCDLFEQFECLKNLNDFVRFRKADEEFFGVKLKKRKRVILEKKTQVVPETVLGKFVLFMRGEKVGWRIKEVINLQ